MITYVLLVVVVYKETERGWEGGREGKEYQNVLIILEPVGVGLLHMGVGMLHMEAGLFHILRIKNYDDRVMITNMNEIAQKVKPS